MGSYIDILFKGVSSVAILFILSKLMGRKQVGQMNVFDYIIGISIGSIAAEMTLNNDVEFFEGALAITLYAILAYLISILTIKSVTARRLITGTPCALIQNGKLIKQNLRKSKIDINDLLEQARIGGYFDLSEIEFALMEANGDISFLPKSKYVPLTPNDMKIKTDYKGLTSNLLIDGKVLPENLKEIGKDEKWLLTRLKKQGYQDISNLFLVICDSKEKLTIYEKNIELKETKVLE